MKQTIEKFLQHHFEEHGWTWNLKGRGKVAPVEQDFRNALDEAARLLYAEKDSGRNTIQLGRLIIIKNEDDSFDVYVLAGSF